MNVLRSLAFYALFYPGSALLTLLVAICAPFGDGVLVWLVRRWTQFHRWCVTRLLGIRVEMEGGPSAEPALYAIRHESFFEAIDAPVVFGRPSVFAKQELFAIPGWGAGARRYGLVPVARDQGAKALMAMIRAARALSAAGRPLVIFPEGTRVPHGEVWPLQSGFAGLYKMLGLPVIPVAVNSGPLYHRRWKRRGTIT